MTTREPNEKRGERAIEIGGITYIVRYPFTAMQELKAKLGKSVLVHLKEAGENLDFDDLAMILSAGLKHGGNEMDEKKLLDELDVAHVADYSAVLSDAFGSKVAGAEAGEEDPSTGKE